jgi:hypothetical protein
MHNVGELTLVDLLLGLCMVDLEFVWVIVVVLLNIILYYGNSLCRYLVDLDAVSLVS